VFAKPMNQNGVLLQPSQGTSYWVLGDLYTFKTVSKHTNGTYSLMKTIVYPQTRSPPTAAKMNLLFGTPADDPTAPPPITDADIQKAIALAPQYRLTILPPDSAID